MSLFSKIANWFDPPSDDPYHVPVRVRPADPERPNRPITLVLGSDGLVWWEYRDTEGDA